MKLMKAAVSSPRHWARRNRQKTGWFLLALCLGACQSAPLPRVQTVEVKIPVAVQPITAAQVPAVPAPLGPRPQSLSAAADLLLAKYCEFVAYALKADPLLRLSAGMAQQPLPQFPECEGK